MESQTQTQTQTTGSKIIRRKLRPGDTLVNLALKYGVGVQDLKRENRLYTNDSLFLRETLLIPLTAHNEDDLSRDDEIVVVEGPTAKLLAPQPHKDAPHRDDASAFSSSPLRNGGGPTAPTGPTGPAVLHVHNELTGAKSESGVSGRSVSDPLAGSRHAGRSMNGNSRNGAKSKNGSMSDASSGPAASASTSTSTTSSSSSSSSSSAPSASSNSASSSTTDFFSKYDQSIAFLKGEIARMENNATNLEGLMEANPLALPARKGSQSGSYVSYQVADEEADGAPVLLIRSRTNNRQIKSTLERSQQASDELFEL